MALALGCFISEIDEMPHSEFVHWQAYYALEPFGQTRDNFHAGIVASTIANVHCKKQYKPDHFMFIDPASKRQKGFQEFIAGIKALARPKQVDDGQES